MFGSIHHLFVYLRMRIATSKQQEQIKHENYNNCRSASSQALPGYLITAPPCVCVPAVIGVLAVWIQHQKKERKKERGPVTWDWWLRPLLRSPGMGEGRDWWGWPMGVIAKGIPRGCQGLFTPVSLGYPLSFFNKNSTLYSHWNRDRWLFSRSRPC